MARTAAPLKKEIYYHGVYLTGTAEQLAGWVDAATLELPYGQRPAGLRWHRKGARFQLHISRELLAERTGGFVDGLLAEVPEVPAWPFKDLTREEWEGVPERIRHEYEVVLLHFIKESRESR